MNSLGICLSASVLSHDLCPIFRISVRRIAESWRLVKFRMSDGVTEVRSVLKFESAAWTHLDRTEPTCHGLCRNGFTEGWRVVASGLQWPHFFAAGYLFGLLIRALRFGPDLGRQRKRGDGRTLSRETTTLHGIGRLPCPPCVFASAMSASMPSLN